MLRKKGLLSILLSIVLIATMVLSVSPIGTLTASASSLFPMVISDSSGGSNRYLTTQNSNAFNVIMYNNTFSGTFGDQHMGGIELSMHGYRIATNGDLHMLPTPEQWDATPAPSRGSKRFDAATNTITVPMTFSGSPDGTLKYDLVTTPIDGGFSLKMVLQSDIPADLIGKARFNLEFIPSRYESKSFQSDGNGDGVYDTFGIFPLHPKDELEETERPNLPSQAWYVQEWNEDRGNAQPLPFATGYEFSFAPEDELYNINIKSKTGELELFDGRNRAQNGWYVLSNLLDSGKAGDTIMEWEFYPNLKEEWVRTPNIGFSQAGYSPEQEKYAVMELDKWDNNYPAEASLVQIQADGTKKVVYTNTLTSTTNWQRFKYARFDFSEYKQSGMYLIRFGDQETEVFPIEKGVYDKSWQTALSGFLAVQMDHMEVREGYRIWHDAPHMDDCSIGALGKSFFDGQRVGGSLSQNLINRGIEPEKHIDGLNVGGWFDAGDFDIQTPRNTEVTEDLIYAAEAFDNMRGYDTLSVTWNDATGGVAEMHRPDGIPDVVQQVNHGIKHILAQYEILGDIGGTMEVRTLRQYTHLGDPSTDTDGYIYDPTLGENEIVERDGKAYSGRPDDRYLMIGNSNTFGNNTNLLGRNSANFAGAAYVLKDYYPDVADRCMTAVLEYWDRARASANPSNNEWATLVQLMLATNKYKEVALAAGDAETAAEYETRFNYFKNRLSGLVDAVVTQNGMGSNYTALFIMDLMDDAYRAKVKTAVEAYGNAVNQTTPYGVQWTTGSGWGGSPSIIGFGQRLAIMNNYFPTENMQKYILRSADYILGCHPANNHSWLSGVGTKSLLHPYNSNRGDEGFIPGSILPGHITFSPDYVESLDDFSFLWFENESIINYQSQWIVVGLAASEIANAEAAPVQAENADFQNDYMMDVKVTGTDRNGNPQGYLQTNGFNLFMYNTTYDRTFGDQKCAGIELIQNGKRVATNGDIHLLPTPEQWDATPAPTRNSQTLDEETDTVSASLTIPAESTTGNPAVNYTLKAEPEAGGVKLTVKLDEALPADLVGKAGFNLEFIPSEFIGKSFQADSDGDGNYDDYGVFPLVASDDMEAMTRARTGDQLWYVQQWNEQRGDAQPLPISTGKKMTFAAEDDENRIRISTDDGTLQLFDGRNRAQNGWFVLRNLIPSGETELVWHISADVESDWARKPNVAHSQVGYEPALSKVAVIELDPNFADPGVAYLDRLNPDGTYEQVFSANLGAATSWLRYSYRNFDFSSFTTPGMYAIRYAGERTDVFPIAKGVYEMTWQSSLSGFLGVQMDHMKVREGYKIWHNPSHMDDALQAPLNTPWFDGWRMGAETDSPYDEYEHIPGLNVGGWYDAGDFDIQTSRNLGVIQDLTMAYSEFDVTLDTLSVDFDARDVELHRPDGYADIQQQVKQGILQILAQIDSVGFLFPVIEVPTLRQYTHLGDGSSDTDNRVYDPTLSIDQLDGLRSGRLDDRMALVGKKSSSLQFSALAALAGSSVALKGYDDALAKKCLDAAVKIWNEEEHTGTSDWNAALEMVIATNGAEPYKARALEILPTVIGTNSQFGRNGWKAVRLIPYMDADLAAQIKAAAVAYVPYLDQTLASNPFGVQSTFGMWGGSGSVISMGVTMATLYRYFPDVISSEYAFRAMNYILGTHPYNSTSWLSGSGTKSVEIAYGSNRADNFYIAGGIVPGYVNIAPDFPEALDDYGFLWFESEYVIDLAAKWVVLANSAVQIAANDVKFDGEFLENGVFAKASNNTTEAVAGTAIAAIYGSGGAMVEFKAEAMNIEAFSTWSNTFDFDFSKYPVEEYTYKLFFWDSNNVPFTEPFEKGYDFSKPRLTSLSIDGVALSEFDPETYAYYMTFDEKSDTAPVVSATASSKLNVTVDQADGIPGEATVSVGTDLTSVSYKVYYAVRPTSSSFVDGKKDVDWTILNEDTSSYSIDKGLGLRLPTQVGDIYSSNKNWNNLFVRPAGGNWEAVAKVYYPVAPHANYQQIMFVAIQDDDNYIRLNCQGASPSVQFGNESGGSFSGGGSSSVSPAADGSLTLYLKITKDGDSYTGAYSRDGINYTSLGSRSASLNDVKLGLFATKNSQNAIIDTYCEYVTITKVAGREVKSYEAMMQDAVNNVASYVLADIPKTLTGDISFSNVPHGYTIVGVSSDPSILTNEGVNVGSGTVAYTVTVSDGTYSKTETININVA